MKKMKKYILNKPTANVRIQYVPGDNETVKVYAVAPIGDSSARLTKQEVVEMAEFLLELAVGEEE